jgi:uncharacterized membrane-anchored protein YitT (DUF2179 family)
LISVEYCTFKLLNLYMLIPYHYYLFDFVLFYCFQVLNKHAINSIAFELKAHFEKTYKMWLSLIKSREWLNRNFSNKSQNWIGFKFGFYTCLSVLIIPFCLSLGLQWNWWRWKATEKYNKYIRNSIFLFRNFSVPKLSRNKDHKSGRI